MKESGFTKELVEKLMKIKGETRGMSLKDDAVYVLSKKGEVGLKKVEEELEKVGCPIKYEKIRSLEYYPIGWRAISLLALKKTFGWGDEEFRELGGFAPGNSIIVRVYTKFFHSIRKVAKVAPRIFEEYFTVGELVVPDYDEEKKYAITEVKGLNLHPVFCRLLEGYLASVVNMVVKSEEVRGRETKCTFAGQDCHRFEVTWK